MSDLTREQQQVIERLFGDLSKADPPRSPPPSTPYRGGGNGDDMEGRVAKLEAHMEHVRSQVDKLVGRTDAVGERIGAVSERMSRLEVKVDHLPSKGFMFSTAAAIVFALAAVVTFSDKLQALVG